LLHAIAIQSLGTPVALGALRNEEGCDGAPENKMKIYLLMLLIGTILTAIRFTSAPDTHAETRPQ
jgi:hypothetical protein